MKLAHVSWIVDLNHLDSSGTPPRSGGSERVSNCLGHMPCNLAMIWLISSEGPKLRSNSPARRFMKMQSGPISLWPAFIWTWFTAPESIPKPAYTPERRTPSRPNPPLPPRDEPSPGSVMPHQQRGIGATHRNGAKHRDDRHGVPLFLLDKSIRSTGPTLAYLSPDSQVIAPRWVEGGHLSSMQACGHFDFEIPRSGRSACGRFSHFATRYPAYATNRLSQGELPAA